MNDALILQIPAYTVDYSDTTKQYGWRRTDAIYRNTYNALAKASKGYCMYCFGKIKTDRREDGQIEHAIEKSNSDYLKECVPNLGLACGKCNQSLKRRGENKRNLSKNAVLEFEKNCECSLTEYKLCQQPCAAYNRIKSLYLRNRYGKILLQPLGVKNDSDRQLLLQFDVFTMEFQPSAKYNYTKREKEIIKQHINHFCLNDPNYRTYEVFYYIEDVINSNSLPNEKRYDNYMVFLFAEELKKHSLAEAIDICKSIYRAVFIFFAQ